LRRQDISLEAPNTWEYRYMNHFVISSNWVNALKIPMLDRINEHVSRRILIKLLTKLSPFYMTWRIMERKRNIRPLDQWAFGIKLPLIYIRFSLVQRPSLCHAYAILCVLCRMSLILKFYLMLFSFESNCKSTFRKSVAHTHTIFSFYHRYICTHTHTYIYIYVYICICIFFLLFYTIYSHTKYLFCKMNHNWNGYKYKTMYNRIRIET